MPLLVCRTCPRYESDSGSSGDRLDPALATAGPARKVRVRHVPCVGGCPQSGNVALDAGELDRAAEVGRAGAVQPVLPVTWPATPCWAGAG